MRCAARRRFCARRRARRRSQALPARNITRWIMGRYLIAGAGGYVGSRLAEYLLAQGHHVRGLVRDTDTEIVQRLAGLGMAVWQGDVTQPESLVGVANGVERVFNLTARFVLENGSV